MLPADLFADLTEYMRLGYGGAENTKEPNSGNRTSAGRSVDFSDSTHTVRAYSVGTD